MRPHNVFGNRLPALSIEIAESRFSGSDLVMGSESSLRPIPRAAARSQEGSKMGP